MVTIDGSLLVGIAAILSSLGGLLRAIKLSPRGRTDTRFNRGHVTFAIVGLGYQARRLLNMLYE